MSKKILIIDDDATIRMMVKAILEAEGFEVNEAENGLEGVEKLEASASNPVDLVILDVIMPGMNGIEVLAKIKEDENLKSLPVLMLTGEAKAEDIMNGYSVGADYYITKPFTRQQLLYGLNLVLSS